MDPDKPKQKPKTGDDDAAVEMIRHKINDLYSEPSASTELSESQAAQHRSKHQRFMYELNRSGKSLAQIQTEWHNYYISLPDDEKHDVWEEFYKNYGRQAGAQTQTAEEPPKHAPLHEGGTLVNTVDDGVSRRSAQEVKQQLLGTVGKRRKVQRKRHASSLFVGLAFGSLFVLVLLFSFFNERFIAPFIAPSRNVSATPIIIDPNSTAVGPEPKIIIPKINVELPVIYDEPSVDEKAIQRALEDGVLHYANTPYPGQKGNGVIFGHSSNNILNHGKYKFAFVLLKRLEVGDTFMLQKDGKRYVYKVYVKKIVKPDDLSVLGNTDKMATFTLITCDPPGTSINRLIVVGEQITPDPSTNSASTAEKTTSQPKILPSNAPSLWSRIWGWFSN